jgi:hypothetical protein
MWSRNRDVLNDFVCAARQFYIDSPIPPRKADPDEDRVCTLLLLCSPISFTLSVWFPGEGTLSTRRLVVWLDTRILSPCNIALPSRWLLIMCPLSAPRMFWTTLWNFRSPRNNRMSVGALDQTTLCDFDLRKTFNKCFNIIQHEREKNMVASVALLWLYPVQCTGL